MRIGKILSLPDETSSFGRVLDAQGVGYTVDPGDLPEDAEEGDEVAYKVELWGNDSGMAFNVKET